MLLSNQSSKKLRRVSYIFFGKNTILYSVNIQKGGYIFDLGGLEMSKSSLEDAIYIVYASYIKIAERRIFTRFSDEVLYRFYRKIDKLSMRDV